MSHRVSFRPAMAAAVVAVVGTGTVHRASAAAAVTANAVVAYAPGTLTGSYVYPSSSWTAGPALGLPATTEGYSFDNSVVTPFNAQYNPADMVGLAGTGGSIEFHLSAPLATTGRTLGVHSSAGLSDAAYPAGTNLTPAEPYTSPRSATVLVSQDGTRFVSLGVQSFDLPTNVYTDVSAAQTNTPGTVPADFAKSFTGTLSNFDGETFQQTLATLNGSGGGTWLDLSTTGLSAVNYVEFQTAPGQTLYVNALTGVAAVPEPATVGLLMTVGAATLARRRGRR